MADSRPVVLVTGASGALGVALAASLDQRGFLVVGVSRTASDAAGFSAFYPCDVTMWDDFQSTLDAIAHRFGAPYGVIAAAGRSSGRMALRATASDLIESFELHVVGTHHAFQWGSRLMMRGSVRGRLVAIGSISSSKAGVGLLPYATAKAALHGLVASYAAELGPKGITCNLVQPGLFESELFRSADSRQTQALISSSALRRVASPNEIAAPVAFLLEPAAGFITGTTVVVDGGASHGI